MSSEAMVFVGCVVVVFSLVGAAIFYAQVQTERVLRARKAEAGQACSGKNCKNKTCVRLRSLEAQTSDA